MSVIDFYRTQIRILWEWRGGPAALAKRLVITLVVSTFALYLTAGLLPGIQIGRVIDAAIAVILMALFNALVRPLILAFASSVSLVLTGIMVIVLQVVTFLLIAPLAHGVECRRVLLRPDRLVRLRGDQHGAHVDPRRG